MEITELLNHPERLDRDTLYELRSMLALHPYFQSARLLMLQNLYLLHDPDFDKELRRAAVYITDRKTIFNMIEAAHYQLHCKKQTIASEQVQAPNGSRTVALIDTFLDSIPKEEEDKQPKRRPTPADAAIDYVAYLLESENYDADHTNAPQKISSTTFSNRNRGAFFSLTVHSKKDKTRGRISTKRRKTMRKSTLQRHWHVSTSNKDATRKHLTSSNVSVQTIQTKTLILVTRYDF